MIKFFFQFSNYSKKNTEKVLILELVNLIQIVVKSVVWKRFAIFTAIPLFRMAH